uniref:Uncharacterized protein n=1 Tax=Aegilops tauschii subsp. strangulata TaxID=200361 RepID=A0A453JQ40_AEGTS
ILQKYDRSGRQETILSNSSLINKKLDDPRPVRQPGEVRVDEAKAARQDQLQREAARHRESQACLVEATTGASRPTRPPLPVPHLHISCQIFPAS